MINGKLKQLFIVLIGAILLFSQTGFAGLQTVYAAMLDNAVTISAIDENGEYVIEPAAVDITDKENLLDVLEDVAESVEYVSYDFGKFVSEINGTKQSDENWMYWLFYVNGQDPTAGVESTPVFHGDNYQFILTPMDHPNVTVTVKALDPSGNEVIAEQEVTLPKYLTAYDALKVAAAEQNVEVSVSVDSSMLTFLNDINETITSECEFWEFQVNGESASSGAVDYLLQDQDEITFKVTNWCEGAPSEDENTEDEEGNSEEENNEEANEEETGEEIEEPIEENDEKESTTEYKDALNSVLGYLKENPGEMSWYGFTAFRSAGVDIPTDSADELATSVNEDFPGNAPNLATAVLELSAGGYNAADINGVNLVEKLLNADMPFINFLTYSLLALDSADYEVPSGTKWTRDSLVDAILDLELASGGWAFTGEEMEPDMTGIALLALTPYQERKDVKAAIDRAVNVLSEQQDELGGYDIEYNGGYSAESAAMVIIGLSALGIDATSDDFTKAEGNLLEHLLSFQMEDGSFKHLHEDEESNTFSTNQAALALVAYDKFKNNSGSVFKFTKGTKQPPKQEDEKTDESNGDAKDDAEEKDNEKNQPVDEKDVDNEVSTEDDEDEATPESTNEPSSTEGKLLPKTAADHYTFIWFGFFAAVAGVALFIYHRRKVIG